MKVIKNYLYNAGYQILLMIVPVITVPYVSRVLGPKASGINSYTNSWVTFFAMFAQLGITLYGNREIAYHRDNRKERSVCFWEIEALQLMTTTTSLIVYLLCVYLFSSTFKEYFIYQSLWILGAGVDISWYFMGLEDFKKTVTRNSVVKIISIILTFILIKNSQQLSDYILLLGFAQLVGNLTLWPYLRNSISKVPLSSLRPFSHFYPALWLFIPTITTQVYVVVNRLMLGKMSSQNSLGEFDYADKIVKLVLAVVTSIGTVMLPHVANSFANGNKEAVRNGLYKSFEFVTSVSIPLMFGIMAISKKFAPWFLGNAYKETGNIMIFESFIIVFIAWSSVTGTQYLIPVKRVHEYTISVTVGALINILLNFVLIKFYGAIGAAITTSISELIVAMVQLFYVKKDIKLTVLFKSTWKYIISGLVLFIIVRVICNHIRMTIISLCFEVLIGIIVYLLGLIMLKAPILVELRKILTLKNN